MSKLYVPYTQDEIPVIQHQFFRNARFAESQMVLDAATFTPHKTLNIQVDMFPEMVQDLAAEGATNEDVADAFGTFMREQFLAAITEEGRKRELNWENGEKVTEVDDDGHTYERLAEEVQPVYSRVPGEFTKIG